MSQGRSVDCKSENEASKRQTKGSRRARAGRKHAGRDFKTMAYDKCTARVNPATMQVERTMGDMDKGMSQKVDKEERKARSGTSHEMYKYSHVYSKFGT